MNKTIIAAAAGVGAFFSLSLSSPFSSPSVAQTSVSCPTYIGLQATGCTAFGYGDDSQVRDWASLYVGGYGGGSSQFCADLFDYATDWLQSFMTGAFESATLDGRDLDGFSEYDPFGGWHGGWMKEGRLRDTSTSASDRGWWLHNIALHEAAHRACDESDAPGGCDSSDEQSVEQAVDGCTTSN